MATELLGWVSSLILLATLLRQVYKQWRSRSDTGVSKWLFIGQVSASLGYTVYSWLLHNWVFLTSNIAILFTAVGGEWIYLRNRRLQSAREQTPKQGAGSNRPRGEASTA